MHMVAVGVLLARLDIAHDHAVERGAERFDAFDARARQVQTVAEFLDITGHVHVVGQPLQRNLHIVIFPFET